MSSNLKVNTILPSAGTAIGIGTDGGTISLTGSINIGTGATISQPATNSLALGTNSSERLRITSNGKIGIGTDTPSRLLEINTTGSSTEGIVIRSHDSTYPKLQFGANRSNADAFLGLIIASWDGTDVASIHFESGSDTTNKDDGLISFRTASAGTREERLRITSDGKIGINDTAPERTMDVRGSNCMIQLEGTGGSGKQWSLCSADNTTGAAVGTAGMFAIYNDTDSVAALRISNSNYVLRPKLPYFYAYATPTAATSHIHSFGTVNQSSGNPFNNSNGRFTAPVTGFYWFTAGIWCNSSNNTTSVLIQLRKYQSSNSSEMSFAACNHTTQYNSLNVSGGVYLAQNDYVYIQHQGGMTIQPSTPRNFFSGYLVG